MTEADLLAIQKQAAKAEAARKKEIRRQVRLAVQVGRKLPYRLDTLLEAGVGIAAIRKIYRNGNG